MAPLMTSLHPCSMELKVDLCVTRERTEPNHHTNSSKLFSRKWIVDGLRLRSCVINLVAN